MKKNIFKTLAALFVFGSLVLTSCVQNFEGTKPNYEQKKEQFTGNFGNDQSAEGLDEWDFSVDNITDAAKDSEIEVRINSAQYELDLDSVEKAFTFYRLKDNSKYKSFYPEHDGEITKTLLKVTEPSSYTGTVALLYRLDTKEVTTSKIALVVDATKLKYKNGLFVVSNDGNLKAGETTDSFVKYISVDYKADGTSTTALNYSYSYSEDFAPTYTYSIYSLSALMDLEDNDGNPTGKTRYYVYAKEKTYEYPYTYDESLAGALSKMFKLEIQKPGSTKWESGEALTFTYHADSKTGNVDPYYAHTYTTDTPVLEAGTKWRIVHDSSVSIGTAPDWYADAYGHPVFKDDRKVLTTVSEGIVAYGDKDTDFLFAYGNSGTPGTFKKDECDYLNAMFTQSGILSNFQNDRSKFTIYLNPSYAELDKTDGFILVNTAKKNAIVPSVTTVHKNADEKIDKVFIAPKDANIELNGDFDIYVGSGTTLKENKDYPKQLKFGCYPDQSKGELSGYVMLVQNPVQPGSAFTTADEWRSAMKADIETHNYREYDYQHGRYDNKFSFIQRVYLLAGETYTLQVANGNPSNPNSTVALNATATTTRDRLCYAGEVYLFNANLGDPDYVDPDYNYCKIAYNSTTGSQSIEVDNSGYYYVCVNHALVTGTNTIVALPNGEHLYQKTSLDAYDEDWWYDAYKDLEGNWPMETITNPYYDDVNNPSVAPTVSVPISINVDWDEVLEDGTYTIPSNPDVLYYKVYTDTEGVFTGRVLNPARRIPYYWGYVYINFYMN